MSKSNNKRFLVTTPDETTWDLKQPLLFLGEWCRLFSRRDISSELDIAIHPYHWDDRHKYERDYRDLGKLYEQKLADLSIHLGNMHGVSTEIRYWRIIIGPWLRFFIDAVFDRYELIRTVSETNAISGTRIHTYNLNDWIPTDFQEFYDQFKDDPWNHIIFSECIINSGITFEKLSSQITPRKKAEVVQNPFRKLVKGFLESYLNFLPSRFNKVVIVAANIPLAKLINFQKTLGQLPYVSSPNVRVNDRIRDDGKRASLIFNQPETPFEQLLNKFIATLIPYAYIENFSTFQKKSLSRFPKRPKLILTANAYQGNDGFKIWAAHHVEKNIPLILEQHGGHYGIGLLNQTEDHQLKTADKFASWGWTTKENSNIVSMPAFKINLDKIKYNKSGNILITTATYPRYFYCHFSVNVAGQMLDYVEEQIKFVKLLRLDLLKSLRIRTDIGQYGWDVPDRMHVAGIGEVIESSVGITLINRLVGCRICVSTINATIFLETLAANFPTLVFFDPGKYEIRSEARPMMDQLRKVGILHDTPESAARFLNEIGDDIEQWWLNDEVQEVREKFCNNFAFSSADWEADWVTFLKLCLSSG